MEKETRLPLGLRGDEAVVAETSRASYRSAPPWGLNERAATRFAEAYKSGLSNSRSLGNSLKNDFKPAAGPERLTWPAQPARSLTVVVSLQTSDAAGQKPPSRLVASPTRV